MPAITSITVDDREDTPISHVYTPTAPDGSVRKWIVSDGVPMGDEKLSMSVTKTASNQHKVRIRMVDPIVVTETINAVDRYKVERAGFASLEFTFGNNSTTQERKNLVGKLANLLASSQTFVMDVCEDLEGMY